MCVREENMVKQLLGGVLNIEGKVMDKKHHEPTNNDARSEIWDLTQRCEQVNKLGDAMIFKW